MSTRMFPIGYDLFKALVALVLLLLLWWLWPKLPPPTLSVEVDPSGVVTLSGDAARGRTVGLTVTDATGKTLQHQVRADDGGRWLTALEFPPGRYTARAAIGAAVSPALEFEVPEPAMLAELVIDPIPSPSSSPLALSGTAEPGKTLLFFVDGQRMASTAPIVVGPDGRWSARFEAPPGGHTIYVAYADAPERVSDPLTVEVREAEADAVATAGEEAAPAAQAPAPTGSAETAPGAQPESSAGRAYVVQQDDWLSKLAEEYLGDPARYPEIREATNARAALDGSFATIEDDHLIFPGEKIWIPAP